MPTETEEPGPDALIRENESDYRLHDECHSCWITVGNISVHIRRTDEGVVVDQYPLGLADRPELASCYAFFAEAQLDIDEEAQYNADDHTSRDTGSRDSESGPIEPRG